MQLSHIIGKLVFKKEEGFVELTYRGAPGNIKKIALARITRVAHGYFYLDSGSAIPLHRIVRVSSEGKVLWEKSP
ncbi:MAG: DUF504 domain-containing protein [Candidatus Diapherotrites archaeon]|nr:DUF504 domain-containing protein [Candidatus Diapherotrites archaeon]